MKNTALITGSSNGIGLELAREHAAKGGDLILVARSTDALQKLKAELENKYKVSVMVISADLGVPGAAAAVAKQVMDANVTVDILINNAGFGDYGTFHESDWTKTQSMINLNILALTELCRLFIPSMVKNKKGRIMNIASTAAFFPGPTMAVYYATKHYVLAFSEGISEELKGTGVTVTTLCPGPTESGFQQAADLGESKLVKGKKLPTSAEVAKFGYAEMMKGKVVTVHGLSNKIQAFASRFLPRGVARAMVKSAQAKAH